MNTKFEQLNVLIACRGPVADEALRVITQLDLPKPHVIISKREWLDTLEGRAAWIADRSRYAKLHLIDDYGDMTAIVNIAKTYCLDAIFVGYGFLAENASFAKACEENGISFVGPTSDTLALMGAKDKARQLAVKLGIPVAPGTDSLERLLLREKFGVDALDAANPQAELFTEAEIIQCATREIERMWRKQPELTVRIKASAGGGGKGQRIVTETADIERAVREIWKEIGASQTGSDKGLIVEANIRNARHIEVQVLGDGENVVHFGVRDCSVQSPSYQKLIEIAVHEGQFAQILANLPDDAETALRAKWERQPELVRQLQTAAVNMCRQIGYRGAGTVEFLVDEQDFFYFLEVNPRLQVEHGVSEAISTINGKKLSLIEQQLRIAAGEKLSFRQADIEFRGCALEVRINLMDSGTLKPAPGAAIEQFSFAKSAGVRIEDSGITRALLPNRILKPSPLYDSNISLNIYYGATLSAAVEAALLNLRGATIQGRRFHTTIPFHLAALLWLQIRPFEFVSTRFTKSYLCMIQRARLVLQERILPLVSEVKTKKRLASYQRVLHKSFAVLVETPALLLAFRFAAPQLEVFQPVEFLARLVDWLQIELWPEEREFLRQTSDGDEDITAISHALIELYRELEYCYQHCWRYQPSEAELPKSLRHHALCRRENWHGADGVQEHQDSSEVVSPIHGIFYRVPRPGAPPYVEVGDPVKKGQPLALVGAMKVYQEVLAHRDGIVQEILVEHESLVSAGQKLVLLR